MITASKVFVVPGRLPAHLGALLSLLLFAVVGLAPSRVAAAVLSRTYAQYSNYFINDPALLTVITDPPSANGSQDLSARPTATSTNKVLGWFEYSFTVDTAGWHSVEFDFDTSIETNFDPNSAILVDGIRMNMYAYALAAGTAKMGNIWLAVGNHTVRIERWFDATGMMPVTTVRLNPVAASLTSNVRVALEGDCAPRPQYLRTGESFNLHVFTGGTAIANGCTFLVTATRVSDSATFTFSKVIPSSATLLDSTIPISVSGEDRYNLSYKINGANVGPSINLLAVEFVAINTTAATGTLSTDGPAKTLLATINCATTAPSYSGGSNDTEFAGVHRVATTAAGTYRETGNYGYIQNHSSTIPNWFAYTLPAVSTSIQYVVEADIPDDATRSFTIEIREGGATGLTHISASGADTGREYPNTQAMKTVSMFYWPRVAGVQPRIVVLNAQNGMRAACAAIRLYQVTTLTWMPSAASTRSFGYWFEEPYSVYGPFTGVYATAESRLLAAERWAQTLRHMGGDTMIVTAAAYAAPLYPSANYNLAVTRANVGDTFRMFLLVAEKYGLKVVADFHHDRDIELNYSLEGTSDPQAHLARNNLGQLQVESITPKTTPRFNSLHPVVQAWTTGMMTDFVNRYKTMPSFRGVSLRTMSWQNPGLNNMDAMEWGYDDYTAQQFQAAAGVPDPGAPASRYSNFYLDPANQTTWNNFRVGRINIFYQNLVTALQVAMPAIEVFSLSDGDVTELGGVKDNSIPGFKYINGSYQYGRKSTAAQWDSDRTYLTDPVKLHVFDTTRAAAPWANYVEDGNTTVRNAQIGLTGTDIYVSAHLPPSGRYNLERYAVMMAELDPTLLINGGNHYFIDQPSSREFLAEYRQLPTTAFAAFNAVSNAVVLRQVTSGANVQKFYLVNRTSVPRVTTVTFSGALTLTHPADGAVQPTVSNKLALTLQPFELRYYTVTGTASVSSVANEELLYECESLANTFSSGDGVAPTTDVAYASGGSASKLTANLVGDFVSYTVPSVPAGTYSVVVRVKIDSTRGWSQLDIDGVTQGAACDQYGTTPDTYLDTLLGTVTFAAAGNHVFKFTVAAKTAASSSYSLIFDSIKLVRSVPATELLVETENVATVTNTDTITNLTETPASNGVMERLNGSAIGSNVSYTLPNVAAGTYTVLVRVKKNNASGQCQVDVAGSNQGAVQDLYGTGNNYVEVSLGTKTFGTSGSKVVLFTVTGKNASSSGYALGIDYVRLVAP